MSKISWKALSKFSDDDLLALRLKDLPVSLEGSLVGHCMLRLQEEIDRKGIPFRPHYYVSDEWFSPDAAPGIAVPFYLLHPRLTRLEARMMVNAEGSTELECMKILRHEAGHTIDTAYRLHFRRDWQRVFGSFAKRYPSSYKPNPNSRKFVVHLNGWYAQAHPAEDFAETFAVWLAPRSRWKSVYKEWPALKKLQFVDELMESVALERPKNLKRLKIDPLSTRTITLAQHYKKRQAYYAKDHPTFFDEDLQKIFSSDKRFHLRPSAARFLKNLSRDLAEEVSLWTGVPAYSVSQLISDMIERSKKLHLRLIQRESATRKELVLLLTVVSMRFVYKGNLRVAL